MFGHIALKVPNVSDAVRWYRRNVPGSTVLFEDSTWAVLTSGERRVTFVNRVRPSTYMAFRVDNEELDALAAEYQQPISSHPDGTRSMILTLPGADPVELLAYPKADLN
jgi:hypothetical protein